VPLELLRKLLELQALDLDGAPALDELHLLRDDHVRCRCAGTQGDVGRHPPVDVAAVLERIAQLDGQDF
jgi:hypothetical protein